MYHKVFDYYTQMKQMMDKVDKKLAARTCEEVEIDNKNANISLKKIFDKYERYQKSHKRVPNSKKYDDFLTFAEQMRKYTELHYGKISISAEENGYGIIEMYFDCIVHSESDISRSNILFGLLFLKYTETIISTKEDGINVRIMAELFDIEKVDSYECKATKF